MFGGNSLDRIVLKSDHTIFPSRKSFGNILLVFHYRRASAEVDKQYYIYVRNFCITTCPKNSNSYKINHQECSAV